jgi:CRP/FNR family transcriptional regulator
MKGSLDELSAMLGRVRHFSGIPPADIRSIVSSGQVRKFSAGEFIFLQDAPCAGMFVLLQGQVHLCKLGPQGQQHILSVVEPVIMFNEVAVLDGGPNPATALAHQDCVLWQASYDSFQELLKRYPVIGLGLLRVLATRNRQLVAQFEDLSFRPVPARVALLLLDLSRNGRIEIPRSPHPIHQLAARVGTAPEVVSRALARFKQQGLIDLTRHSIKVNDPAALASLAQLV